MTRGTARLGRLIGGAVIAAAGIVVSALILFTVLDGRLTFWVTTASAAPARTASTQPPQPGLWAATGTVTHTEGESIDHVGEVLQRPWRIVSSCVSTCGYVLIRPVADGDTIRVLSAHLRREAGGWYATWPSQLLTCGQAEVAERETWTLTFSDHGTVAHADESSSIDSPGCARSSATIIWQAAIQASSAGPGTNAA